MGMGRARRAARVLAASGVAAALTAVPTTAHAATEYDGDATALRIEGLQLKLFPHGTQALPDQLRDAIEQLQNQAPEEFRRSSLTLAMPDQVIGHAEFPGNDTQGAIPANPLLTADLLEAKSIRLRNGDLVSDASVAGLSIGGGVLAADLITTSCTGNGERMSVDVSQLELSSNEDIVNARVSLEPGTATPIPGLGTITFNQQETDGSTYAEGTNVVIDLDSDLSLDALLQIFDITPRLRAVLDQVLADIGDGKAGNEKLPQELTDGIRDGITRIAEPVEQGGDEAADEIVQNSEQAEAVKSALNEVVHLDGTITVANAACAQQTVAASAPRPLAPPQQAAPAQPVAAKEPPLADTGSPAGLLGMGVAGVAALVAGGVTLLRLRRRET